MPKNTIKRIKIISYCLFVLLAAEALLRVQQKFGPIVDLKMQNVSAGWLSDKLNHQNNNSIIEGPPSYWLTLKIPPRRYDKYGIRIESQRPFYAKDKSPVTVLFMGDSFIEGLDDKHTIPQESWEYLRQTDLAEYPINILNAGCISYSPLIYIVQAKLLIPELKPDLVVVDIDETDFLDDEIRYAGVACRDKFGNLTAVKPNRRFKDFLEGLLEIKKQPSYLVRLIMKFYHTRIYMPLVVLKYPEVEHRDKMMDSYLDGLGGITEDRYNGQFGNFAKNLQELGETLIKSTGGKENVLFLYHSHKNRIKNKTLKDTPVSAALKYVSGKLGLPYYDATHDLAKAFGAEPDKYYVAGDNCAHFNFAGADVYGRLVGKQLEPMVRRIREKKDGT